MKKLIAGCVGVMMCTGVYAQDTFEDMGMIRAIDAPVRTITLAQGNFRIAEGVYVNDKGKRLPAMIAIQPGDGVSFDGVVLPGGEYLIQSIEITYRNLGEGQSPQDQE